MDKHIDVPENGLECAFWEALKYICESYNDGWLSMSRDDWGYDEEVIIEDTGVDGDNSFAPFLTHLQGGKDEEFSTPWNPTNEDMFQHKWIIHR